METSAAKLPRTNPGHDRAESAGPGIIGFADDGDFSAVFDSSAEALLVADTQGMILKANRRARELLRYKETGPRKSSLGEYFATPPAAQITEVFRHDGNAENNSRVEALLLSGSSVPITLRAILPRTKNLLLCLEEGSVVQRAEGKWRQVQSEMESLLDSVEAGVILYDPTGAVRFINARFAQLFGLDVQQLRSLEDFDDLAALLAACFS
ncbi:MAG: PAS domain-containing protein, partial [Candidatus Acidiferrales bacterium]